MRFVNGKIDKGYFFLIFYIFWGWIFSRTIYANALFVYLSFLFLFISFTLKLINKNSSLNVKGDSLALVWTPYYIYTCMGWILQGNVENFVYYYICLVMVLIAGKSNIQESIPYKFIVYGGFLTVASIFLQMLLPNLYVQLIGNKIVYDAIDLWTSGEYGFNGITYQLGKTAEILIAAELVLLYMSDKIKWLHERKILFYIMISLLIVGVFLTGKRMNSLMAILIPMVVHYVSLSRSSGRIRYLFMILIPLGLGLTYIVSNAEALSDNFIFRRIAGSILDSQDDGWSAISGGREELFNYAINMFEQNQIFGAGLGEFSLKYGTAVHNLYLQCLAEQGMVGFILLVIPLLYCLIATVKLITKKSYYKYKSYLLLALAFQLNYIIQGFTDNTSISGFILNAIAIALVINVKSLKSIY